MINVETFLPVECQWSDAGCDEEEVKCGPLGVDQVIAPATASFLAHLLIFVVVVLPVLLP